MSVLNKAVDDKAKTLEKKRKQAKKRLKVDDTLDSEWLPIPAVSINVDDPFKQHCKFAWVYLSCNFIYCF